ncbi:unnamed protein product [Oikopleura dioica]|uniref:ribonuclease H n=1 Tax=Oikopleura dioica TaxID=34765 RepID=E4XZL1_OIKDI|nr:unnamed protein product [Oikopleura dioica]
MENGLYNVREAPRFYAKFTKLTFDASDGAIRHRKVEQWKTAAEVHISDRITKKYKKNPFAQHVNRLSWAWGESPGGSPNMNGSLSIPASLMEFYGWAVEGRYMNFPEIHKIARSIAIPDYWFYTPMNDPDSYDAEEAFMLFKATFFPGHEHLHTLREIYRTPDADDKTVYDYAISAIRELAPIICINVEANTMEPVKNGQVLNLEEYTKKIVESDCAISFMNKFPLQLKMLRSFLTGEMVKVKSGCNYAMISQILKDFRIDHSPSARFPEGTKIGSSCFSARRYTKKEEHTPFGDLMAIVFCIMAMSTKTWEHVLEEIARKEGLRPEKVDMRDLLNNLNYVFNCLDRKTGATGHMEIQQLEYAANINAIRKGGESLNEDMEFIKKESHKQSLKLQRFANRSIELNKIESDLENNIGSASDTEERQEEANRFFKNNNKKPFGKGQKQAKKVSFGGNTIMSAEEFLRADGLVVDKLSKRVYKPDGRKLSFGAFEKVNKEYGGRVMSIFPRAMGERRGIRSIIDRGMKSARVIKKDGRKFAAFECDEEGNPTELYELLAEMEDELNAIAAEVKMVDVDTDREEIKSLTEYENKGKEQAMTELNWIGNENDLKNEFFSVKYDADMDTRTQVAKGRALAKKVFSIDFFLPTVKMLDRNKLSEIKFRLLIDSGASVSLLPESFVSGLVNATKVKTKVAKAEKGVARTAGGGSLEYLPIAVTFTMRIGGMNISINNAKVHKGHSRSLLMSLSDMVLNGISMINSVEIKDHTGPKEMVLMHNGQKMDKIIPKLQMIDAIFMYDSIPQEIFACDTNDKYSNFPHEIENTIERTSTIGERCYDESVVKNMRPTSVKDHVGMRHYLRHIEKEHQKLREINTRSDCTIGPKNDEFDPFEFVEDRGKMIAKIEEIIEKCKVLFEGTQGHVIGKEYEIHAEIVGDTSPKSAANSYGKNRPEYEQKAIIQQLDKELAEGVLTLKPPEMIPAHFVNYHAVGKKNQDTGKVELACGNVRVVVDCARSGINKDTKHLARPTDSIRQVLQKVAPFTKKGFVATIDISSMFYCFSMHRSMWKHFTVMHPHLQLLVYTKLPMGWISSPLLAKEMIALILYEHISKDQIAIYVDDICIFGSTETEFLSNLSSVFNTLAKMNLRLKGKKCTFLSRDIELLGRRIVNGVIKQSPHTIGKIAVEDEKSLSTVKSMKRFLGILAYLSEAIPYKTELLDDLYKLVGKTEAKKDRKPNEAIKWTPELIEKLNKVKSIVNEKTLTELHPLDPSKLCYIVVDSSNLGTGAFMYHLDDQDKPKIVKMYSKKRGDIKNKVQWASCMLEVHGILSAVNYFKYEIDSLDKPAAVLTDSSSCAKLFQKCQTGKDLSNDPKLNERILKLMNFNISITYTPAKMKDLDLADFISRSENLLTKCNNNCKLCIEMQENGMIKEKSHTKLLEDTLNVTFDRQNMRMDRFEEIFKIEKVGEFQRAYKEATEGGVLPYSDEEEEIEMMVTRQRTRNLERKKKGPRGSHEYDNKIIFELIDRTDWKNLVADHKLLREIQMNDKVLRVTIEAKEGGRLPGPKDRPSESLRTNNTVIENGVLRKERIMIGVKAVSPIIIPENMVLVFVKKIHKSFGCGSASKLKNLCKSIVWGKNMAKHAENVTRQCKDCAYLRNPPKIIKNENEHSNRWPDHIGQIFFADIISRRTTTDRSAQPETSMKFYVVSEALSGYVKMYHIHNKENNAEIGSGILIKSMYDLAVRPHGTLHKTIAMDGAPVNRKIAKNPIWEDLNVTIEIMDKTSNNKNYLAPLDSRMQKLSCFLNQIIGKKYSPDVVAHKVCDRYNATPGAAGYSPNEIWFGTDQHTGKRLDIDMGKIKEKVKDACKLARDANDRNNSRSKRRLPMILKPYEEGDKYGDDHKSLIKTGDLVLIEGEKDKNETHPFYEIVPIGNFDGIDWEHRVIHTKRHNVIAKKIKTWGFDSIRIVLDGNNGEAVKQLRSKEEQRMPDKFDSRTIVYNMLDKNAFDM